MKYNTVFLSILAVAITTSLNAEKLPESTLDLLSAEASDTQMTNAAPAQANEAEPPVAPTEDTDIDSLSSSVANQLSNILGEATEDSEAETEAKLEKVVTTELMRGTNMDVLRSAVSDAMRDIAAETEQPVEEKSVEQVSKSLQKLIGEQETTGDNASDNYLQSLRMESEEFEASKKDMVATTTPETETAIAAKSEASSSNPETATPDPDTVETVTVLAGESLYKIALRVYGQGDQYLKLFEANKDIINNPDVVRIGQILKVPR